jgi:hypothetical protein
LPSAFRASILSFFYFFLASSISNNFLSSSYYFLSSSSSFSLNSFSILSYSAFASSINLFFSNANAAAAFTGFFLPPLPAGSFFSSSFFSPSFC